MTGLLGVALGASVIWLYAGVTRALLVEWFTSPDASYGLILGGVVAALVWRRRRLITVAASSPMASAAAVFIVGFGLALYLAGLFAADLYTTRASFVVVAAGLLWFLGGAGALRVMAAPLFFLLLAVPIPQLVVNTITLPLQLVASRLAEMALTSGGVPVFREGNVLELPSVTLEIVEACSGLRSAVSLISVAALLAWATGGSAGRRLFLIAAAIPIAVFMNGMRVAATGAASETWGVGMTVGTWHTATGWATFVLSLAALLATERWLSRTPAALRPAVIAIA
ncbi:MAG: exosortase/archaeosortase family protein [Gammaproteobacteria bacterium]